MDLEEMEGLWQAMSLKIENQKRLTDSIIIKMIQTRYKKKINKILIPEAIGSVICFAAAAFILAGLPKLDPGYLLVCGITSASILLILPTISIAAIRKIKSVNISANTYKQSLVDYSKARIRLVFVHKVSFCLAAALMLVTIPVMGKLIAGADLFKTTSLWYGYVIAFPFFYYFAARVFRSYRKIASDAENILKELEVR